MHSGNESTDETPHNKEQYDDTASINSSSIGVTLDKNPTKKSWKCNLGGMSLVVLSVVVLSAALTVGLVLSIIMGSPQVEPHGIVVSESEYCNEHGLDVMKKFDGTAVDAAVATALCLTVMRPDLASLAGCGMMLVKDRDTQTSWLYDFQCAAPSNPVAVDPTKPETLVAVPGFIKGLQMAHSKFGKRTWASLFAGALQAAREGFTPSSALLNQAQSVKTELKADAGPIVDNLILSTAHYKPPEKLVETLKTLSTDSGSYFYTAQKYPSTFGNGLITFLTSKGNALWEDKDLTSYEVLQPRPLITGFAGFNVETFPAPSSGGAYLLSILENLNLKNKLSPLDSESLRNNDANTTAIMLHRLIEFAKLAEVEASKLGDPTDEKINSAVLKQQNYMFLDKTHRTMVEMVNDTSSVLSETPIERPADFQIGDTSIVTSDADDYTVVLTSYLGAPFGIGQVVPDTGVHLNAALKLFSPTSSDPTNPILNTLAGGRRPLVPTSPIYVSTAGRKCGIRFGLGTSGGWWGMMDSAQVLTNGALFLRGSTCLPSGSSDPYNGATADQESKKIASKDGGYRPATEYGCLNGQTAIDAARVHSGSIQPVSGQTVNGRPVFYETGLRSSIVGIFGTFKHPTVGKPTDSWPSGVGLAGWNVYDVIGAVDKRESWSMNKY